MAAFETIYSSRLRLEPFSAIHLNDRYVSWLNDPEVVRHSEQRHRTHSLDTCRAYWSSFEGTQNCLWAIIANDAESHHIGNLSAHVDENNAVSDLAILIGERNAWGRGYGREAWFAACDFLLRSRALRKISAGTLACNSGMLRIARSAGMVEEGRRVRHYLVAGEETDVLLFGLFREVWLKTHPTAVSCTSRV